MKFLLLHGSHMQDGEVCREGDVVESRVDLREVFVNKFELPPEPRRYTLHPTRWSVLKLLLSWGRFWHLMWVK